MKHLPSLLIAATLFVMFGCGDASEERKSGYDSPEKKLHLELFLDNEGRPGYLLKKDAETIVDSSWLGLDLMEQEDLVKGLEEVDREVELASEAWETVWGERKPVANHRRIIRWNLKEKAGEGRKMTIEFRLYDDGLGFRYDIPVQEAPSQWKVANELTQFKMAGDHTAFWIPGDYDSYEHLYSVTPLSELDASIKYGDPKLIASSILEPTAVNTPVTLVSASGTHISLHEAALVDYPGMTLRLEDDDRTFTSSLVPSPEGWKAKFKIPFTTPWRTITVAENAAGLATSDLILNLNEPSKLTDTDWIQPQKYMGIWWGMHIDKNTWHAGPKHGATTENAKKFIDFASENGIPALLIEGWNTGWENWFDAEGRKDAFDWVTPYPDFDLEAVVAYGKSKGVNLVGHHETSSVVYKYDTMMEAAFAQCEALGIPAVKTGYVGKILPEGEYHHGQWMVQHYQRSVETAARHKVMVDIHEPIKPTGLRRTWPNLMTREGVRGTEFNAWADGNPPSHITILPFTRQLGGPIDYTPGIFDLTFNEYKPDNQVWTTLANQLAQYVVLYSPLAMAADLPENYEGHPAFEFIREVPTDWEETLLPDAVIGEYVVTARRERSGDRWFLGAVTNEKSRVLTIALDFLAEGKTYTAKIFRDGADADYRHNPGDYAIETRGVTQSDRIEVTLRPGGGVAVMFEVK